MIYFLFTFISSSSTEIEAVVEGSWQKIGATIRGASEAPTLWPTSEGAEKCVTKLLVHEAVGNGITATRQISQKLGQRYLGWTHLLVETSRIKGIPAIVCRVTNEIKLDWDWIAWQDNLPSVDDVQWRPAQKEFENNDEEHSDDFFLGPDAFVRVSRSDAVSSCQAVVHNLDRRCPLLVTLLWLRAPSPCCSVSAPLLLSDGPFQLRMATKMTVIASQRPLNYGRFLCYIWTRAWEVMAGYAVWLDRRFGILASFWKKFNKIYWWFCLIWP